MDIKKVDELVDEHKRLFREAAGLQRMRVFTNKSYNDERVTLTLYVEHPQAGTLEHVRYLKIDKELFREFIDKMLEKKHKRMEEIDKLFAKVKE